MVHMRGVPLLLVLVLRELSITVILERIKHDLCMNYHTFLNITCILLLQDGCRAARLVFPAWLRFGAGAPDSSW